MKKIEYGKNASLLDNQVIACIIKQQNEIVDWIDKYKYNPKIVITIDTKEIEQKIKEKLMKTLSKRIEETILR